MRGFREGFNEVMFAPIELGLMNDYSGWLLERHLSWSSSPDIAPAATLSFWLLRQAASAIAEYLVNRRCIQSQLRTWRLCSAAALGTQTPPT